jgi:tRNA (cmo5U34)-methyltransferase
MADSRQHQPEERWEFNAEVTECFSDMLRRSIPQYDLMRETVTRLGERFLQPDTAVVDLGCSRGDALEPFVELADRAIGVETSEPMVNAARSRFDHLRNVEIRELDLRKEYPRERASLTLAVLTLQFVPIEYRQSVVRSAYRRTVSGGAMILVEKVLGSTADADEILVEQYVGMKSENGYSQDSIDRKRHALEGILVPVTAAWNEQILSAAGFGTVECFWRWMNFAGWLAIKSSE